MTCWQSSWGLHDALTYADACSDLGQVKAFAGQHCVGLDAFLKKNDLAHVCISNASLCISCVRDTAAKSGFITTISHNVKFLKGYSFKIEGYH